MMGIKTAADLIELFISGIFSYYGEHPEYPSWVSNKWSMEQLWFAFVMKEKYGKVWDGESWKIRGDLWQ